MRVKVMASQVDRRVVVARIKGLSWTAGLDLAKECMEGPPQGYRVVQIRLVDRNRAAQPAISISFRRGGEAVELLPSSIEDYLRRQSAKVESR